ncbi:MAG: site-specific integrase [Cyclobacteriaceae bacterium]|nr:site-specific integrase [Cyclobacteriaceae bacterium]
MAKARLFIRPNAINRNGETGIYVRLYYRDSSIDISTKELIEPKHWDERKQCVRKSYKGHTSINNYLQKVLMDVETIRLNIQMTGKEPLPKEVKNQYLNIHTPQPAPAPINNNALHYWDTFVAYKLSKGEIGHKSHKQYKSTLKFLIDYEEFTDSKIHFDKIDVNFYDSLLLYLYDHLGVNPNTAGNRIKQLKTFLAWSLETELTTNSKFKKFKKPSCEVSSVALNQEQLDKLFFLDLKSRPELEISRDLFTIGCATGYRFSDFIEIKKEHIKGDFLIKTINKTQEQIRVPLNSYSRAIINKYPKGLPNVDDNYNGTMNLHLKEIARLAGFNDLHELTIYPGNKMQKVTRPMHEILSTHCARRTFASQSLQRGMLMTDVMKCTGHKDTKTFLKYVKTSEPRLLEVMSKAWDTIPT